MPSALLARADEVWNNNPLQVRRPVAHTCIAPPPIHLTPFPPHTTRPWRVHGSENPPTWRICRHIKTLLAFEDDAVFFKAPHAFEKGSVLQEIQAKPWMSTIPVDGSPGYLRNLDAPLRLKSFCNYTTPPKFVVTLCDQANRTWSHFKHQEFSDQDHHVKRFGEGSGRVRLLPEELPGAYRDCVLRTLPVVRSCLRRFSYEQCGRLFFAHVSPGAHEDPDSFGVGRPCTGVVWSSLHTEMLEHWMRFFPRQDFLVVHRDDWADRPQELMGAVSSHFGVPMKEGAVAEVALQANYHAGYEGIEPPEDVQSELSAFFGERRGWEKHITAFSTEAGEEEGAEIPVWIKWLLAA